MKAKLALALAIAPKPDMLILDEPTAGLAGHGLVAVAAWSCSGIAFQWRDGFVSRGMDRMSTWRFAGGLIWMARLAAVLV